MKAYMTLKHGSSSLGTLYFELFENDVPKTVKNFVTLLQRRSGGYLTSPIHRVIKGFMAQGGDFTKGNGTGGESIYGKTFDDENFIYKHSQPGRLSMANSGPNTNGSQFFITFNPTPHLDGRHVVFGQVDLNRSKGVLDLLERVGTNGRDVPIQPVTITDCGIVEAANVNEAHTLDTHDEDEIDLDEEEQEESLPLASASTNIEEPVDSSDLKKGDALKLRLRKLKQKMAQARQLNKMAVKEEGERMSNVGGGRDGKRQSTPSNGNPSVNTSLAQLATKEGMDANLLTEPANVTLEKARRREEKDAINEYQINDYHNPEGQHRNYLRNVKSLPQNFSHPKDSSIFNPIADDTDPVREQEGARKLAADMHRRIEKRQDREREKKRKEIVDDANVSHINPRNKRFNEKINRTYDKQTAEIRQNLERGTAL